MSDIIIDLPFDEPFDIETGELRQFDPEYRPGEFRKKLTELQREFAQIRKEYLARNKQRLEALKSNQRLFPSNILLSRIQRELVQEQFQSIQQGLPPESFDFFQKILQSTPARVGNQFPFKSLDRYFQKALEGQRDLPEPSQVFKLIQEAFSAQKQRASRFQWAERFKERQDKLYQESLIRKQEELDKAYYEDLESEQTVDPSERAKDSIRVDQILSQFKFKAKPGGTTRFFVTDAGQITKFKYPLLRSVKDFSTLRYVDIPTEFSKTIAPEGFGELPAEFADVLQTVEPRAKGPPKKPPDTPLEDLLDLPEDSGIPKSDVRSYVRDILNQVNFSIRQSASEELKDSKKIVSEAKRSGKQFTQSAIEKLKRKLDEDLSSLDSELEKLLSESKARSASASISRSSQAASIFSVAQFLGFPGYAISNVIDTFFNRPEEQAIKEQEAEIQRDLKTQTKSRKEELIRQFEEQKAQILSSEQKRIYEIETTEKARQNEISKRRDTTLTTLKSAFVDKIYTYINASGAKFSDATIEAIRQLRGKSPKDAIRGLREIFLEHYKDQPLIDAITGKPIEGTSIFGNLFQPDNLATKEPLEKVLEELFEKPTPTTPKVRYPSPGLGASQPPTGSGPPPGKPPVFDSGPPPELPPGSRISPIPEPSMIASSATNAALIASAAFKTAKFVNAAISNNTNDITNFALAGSSPTAQTSALNNLFQKVYDPMGVNMPMQLWKSMSENLAKIEENTRKDTPFATPMTLVQSITNDIALLLKKIEEGPKRDPILAALTRERGELAEQLEDLKTKALEAFGPIQQLALMIINTGLKNVLNLLEGPIGVHLARGLVGGLLGGPAGANILTLIGVLTDRLNQAKQAEIDNNLLGQIREFLNPDPIAEGLNRANPGSPPWKWGSSNLRPVPLNAWGENFNNNFRNFP